MSKVFMAVFRNPKGQTLGSKVTGRLIIHDNSLLTLESPIYSYLIKDIDEKTKKEVLKWVSELDQHAPVGTIVKFPIDQFELIREVDAGDPIYSSYFSSIKKVTEELKKETLKLAAKRKKAKK